MINPFHPNVAFHVETSHLFCSAKQMTGFYMERNTGLKWVNIQAFTQNQVFRYVSKKTVLEISENTQGNILGEVYFLWSCIQ